jgi:hypothetical protein
MSVPLADTGPVRSDGVTSGTFSRFRHEAAAAILILFALTAIVLLAWVLYNRPAHSFQVNRTWTSDVKLAISEGKPVGPIRPTGPLKDIPGVGRIDSVIVERPAPGNRVMVLFLTVDGWNSEGLAYIKGYSPPSDTCNFHLGGPWWQLGQLNTTTMGCARGFTFTGGG